MTKQSWLKKIIFTTFLILIVIVLFNFIINPYGVFNIKNIEGISSTKNNSTSSEMSKFHYALRENPSTIMLGSSRVEHMNPKYLEKYTKDKVYNLGIKGSGITTQYNILKYFIENKNIKTVILGLDFYAFSPINVNTSVTAKRYKGDFINDYLDSLFSFRTFRKSINTLKDNLKNKEFRVDQTNGWDNYNMDYNSLSKNGDKWLENRVNSGFPNFGQDKHFFGLEAFKKKESINSGLEVLNKMINLCKKNNVELRIFTTPVYYKIYDVINQTGYKDTYVYWKKELSKYNLIYDFNYANSITRDYKSYIDSSHYKSKLGKPVFARIYSDNIKDLPKDFGKILTYKN